MSGRYVSHLCEDCGAAWLCTDPICDDTPITICAACPASISSKARR